MRCHIIAFTVVALCAAPVAAASLFDGSWKGDIAASQSSPVPNVYLVKDGKFSCSTCTPTIDVPADGKFHPVAGSPYYDSISVSIVDANTIKRATTKAGKPTGGSTATVSPDGDKLSFAFTDMTATNGVPVTGTTISERVAPAAPGAHRMSGSWKPTNSGEVSESGLSFTLKLDGDVLTYATPTGASYSAKVDGPEAPVKGDPGWTAVTVKREGPNTLFETDFRDGKPIATYRMTVSADGKTLTAESANLLNGRKSTEIARKQ